MKGRKLKLSREGKRRAKEEAIANGTYVSKAKKEALRLKRMDRSNINARHKRRAKARDAVKLLNKNVCVAAESDKSVRSHRSKNKKKRESKTIQRYTSHAAVIYRRYGKSIPPKVYVNQASYDFLTDLRLVRRYICETNDIKFNELELLLYLNGIGLFTKYDFKTIYMSLGMYSKYTFKKYVESGWISKWRDSNSKMNQKELFTTSTKCKLMCDKMHKLLVGDDEVSNAGFIKFKKSLEDKPSTKNNYIKLLKSVKLKRDKLKNMKT